MKSNLGLSPVHRVTLPSESALGPAERHNFFLQPRHQSKAEFFPEFAPAASRIHSNLVYPFPAQSFSMAPPLRGNLIGVSSLQRLSGILVHMFFFCAQTTQKLQWQ